MKLALFAYSRRGCALARRVMQLLGPSECRAFAPERLGEADFLPLGKPSEEFYGELFRWAETMVFVGSCGIAVREIAPHLRSKCTDPAVLCLDEGGHFVIPLLSGHIGGANDLAARLAPALGAAAVITTATDVRGRFSVDAWAARQGLVIDDMSLAKAVSAAILEGDVPFCSALPVIGDYPAGLTPGETGPLGVCVSWETKFPFERTLRLIPPALRLGLGCRRGVAAETVRRAVETVLEREGIDIRAVRCAASIDLKAEETGLLAFCEEMGWPLHFYTAAELAAAEGVFSPSDFVRSVTGVDNVCERAALLGAERLIVKKTALDGVTVAAAAEHWEVRFG